MTAQSTPYPPLGAHSFLRRLCWLVVGGALMLAGLLTPALANREVSGFPPTPAVRRPTSMATARLSSPTAAPPTPRPIAPTSTPVPPAPSAPLLKHPPLDAAPIVVISAAPKGGDLLGAGAVGRASAQIFLPLVARSAHQPIPLPTKGVTHRDDLSRSTPTTTQVVTPNVAPVVSQATAGQRLFLALVLRPGEGATVALPTDEATSVPTATNGDTHAGAHEQAGLMLFLPLVADTTVQRNAAPSATPVTTDQPSPAATATPTATPSATPTPATAPNQHAQQQLQALLDQVNGLITSGVLNAAQGQPLRQPIMTVMQLPIVTQGRAPSNPTPGQPRPWQRQMQTFSDQVNRLMASGRLSAAQGQPLLDQAQAIIQTLGGT